MSLSSNSAPDFFGDISLETFLSEYWQKKPLLIKNAFPDFEPPVAADELAGLSLEEDVESRLIIQSEDGNDWQLKHGPFDEDTYAELPDKHWTLLVQAVDHWVPEAADLVEKFRFAPNWRLDDLMVSYAADGGGVGPHYDNYDVFLIQASGTRRWEVGGLYDENSPRRPDVPVMVLPDWEYEQCWDLEPGDMLYLPPRVGHNGYALGDDCMTYSVGFRAPSHHEIMASLAQFVEGMTTAEDRYQDSDLEQQINPGEITPAALLRVQKLLHHYIDQPQLLASWFGQYMTEAKHPDMQGQHAEELSITETKQQLQQGTTLVRNEGSRFAFYQENDQVTLFVDGKPVTCSTGQTELVQTLCQQRYLDNVELNDDNLELIQTLLAQGSLYLSEE